MAHVEVQGFRDPIREGLFAPVLDVGVFMSEVEVGGDKKRESFQEFFNTLREASVQ